MRWVRPGIASLFAFAIASFLFGPASADDTAPPAQPAPAKSAEAPKSTTHASMARTPEEMAKEALAKWKTTLKITDEQAPQFESVMTDSYRKMAEAKTAAAGDKTKMKASMQTIMKERDEALSKVLTPDQMKTYRASLNKAVSHAKKEMSKTEGTSK